MYVIFALMNILYNSIHFKFSLKILDANIIYRRIRRQWHFIAKICLKNKIN